MSRNRMSKRLTAFALSAAMVIGPSMTGYATESEQQIAGDDRVQVVVPTDAVGIFDFILDPQELINKTNASAYDGQLFEEGSTVFFKRSEGDALVDYSSISDAVTITNRGSTPIDIVITAGITFLEKDGFAMTEDREFTDDTRASLYLALTDGETEIPIMGEGEEAAELTITIPPASEDEEGENECSFRLTGAANKEGDWSRMRNISFEVTVTWMVEAQEEEEPEEEMPLESEEMASPEEQMIEPVEGSGEEIVRKVVPVVTDSNATVNMEGSETPSIEEETEGPSDNPTEKNETTSGSEEEKPEGVKEETTVEDTSKSSSNEKAQNENSSKQDILE